MLGSDVRTPHTVTCSIGPGHRIKGDVLMTAAYALEGVHGLHQAVPSPYLGYFYMETEAYGPLSTALFGVDPKWLQNGLSMPSAAAW